MSRERRWFAVRTFVVWHRDPTPRGQPDRLFEERITMWRTKSSKKASRLAEKDLRDYCSRTSVFGFTLTPLKSQQTFRADGRPGHGAEVYSMLRSSDLEAGAYLDALFFTGGERSQDV